MQPPQRKRSQSLPCHTEHAEINLDLSLAAKIYRYCMWPPAEKYRHLAAAAAVTSQFWFFFWNSFPSLVLTIREKI